MAGRSTSSRDPAGTSLVAPLREPALRAIWLSLLTSSVGDWAARLALALLLLDRTGSPTLSALVVGVTFVPWAGPGQYLATRTGHLRRVPVMVGADLLRAAVFLALLAVRLPPAGVIGLAFVAALGTPPFETARSALTVEVVASDRYGAAIALLDLTDQSATVIGYLVGGALVAIGGYRVALGVDVGSYLVSALALSRVREQRQPSARQGSATQLGRGLRIIWRDRVIRRGLATVVVTGFGVAAIGTTAAAYARISLHAGAASAGELAAALPVGVIIAIPLLPRYGGARRLLRAAGAAQAVGGAIAVAAFGAGHLAGALVGFFGAGLLTGSVTPAQVAFQPRIPGGDRPSVFAVAQGLAVGIQGVGALAGGLLAADIGPRHGALVWAGAVLVLGAVAVVVPLAARAEAPDACGAPEPVEPRAPEPPTVDPPTLEHLDVVVIGAGFGGIGMATRLAGMGVESWAVLEAAPGPGGVWRDNDYPGAGCDIPSHLYCYSYAPQHWSRRFSHQPEILRYLQAQIDERGISPKFRYGVAVTALTFDEGAGRWDLVCSDGVPRRARVVVSAVGQLNRPVVPVPAGGNSFAGPSWHSSAWDHDVGLAGRRVAVIGTGASAVQLVPEIAGIAAHVDVYQRSAPYVLPKPDRPYSPRRRRLDRVAPALVRLERLASFSAGEIAAVAYNGNSRLLGALTRRWRTYLEAEVADPELRDRCTPDYQLGCKRVCLSSDWYSTITRSDVDLVAEEVLAVDPGGVRTASGTRPADVVIWATGFAGSDFLSSLTVTGRAGRVLSQEWRDGAEAHLGVAVSGYPNLFLLYGPNSNLGTNSIVYVLEAQIGYVAQAIGLLERDGLAWMDVRPEAQRRFNDWLGRASEATTYRSGCRAWYLSASGRNTTNWPALTSTYRRRLARLRAVEFELRRAAG